MLEDFLGFHYFENDDDQLNRYDYNVHNFLPQLSQSFMNEESKIDCGLSIKSKVESQSLTINKKDNTGDDRQSEYTATYEVNLI